MNDEQLDKILKKALTPQREIKEEEIVLKKKQKKEKMIKIAICQVASSILILLSQQFHKIAFVLIRYHLGD